MALFDSLNQMNQSRKQTARRRFLLGALGAVGTYFGYRWWRDRPRPVMQRATKFITDPAEFYTISIDLGFVTKAKPETWRLELAGPEERRAELRYDELLALERRRIYKTLMCVGNEVGGPSLANAEWTVTPLAPMLERILGAQRAGLRAVFYGLDGFYSSVPLAVALHEHSFLAYEMNGAPLANKHGYPARVFLPNVYGMKQPRWLSKIEITDRQVSGYWEKRGWCSECPIKMTARIDAAQFQPEGAFLVTGVAYCGGTVVGQVELSADDGKTWQAAQLGAEQFPNAWTTWSFRWTPPQTSNRKQEHVLIARVSDVLGNRQEEAASGSFPSGATGWHRVIITA